MIKHLFLVSYISAFWSNNLINATKLNEQRGLENILMSRLILSIKQPYFSRDILLISLPENL